MATPIEELQSKFARTGCVEVHYGLTKQLLESARAALRLRRGDARAPQLIVSEDGIWANTPDSPDGGVPWNIMLEVHITKVHLSSFTDLSFRSAKAPDIRRTLRLPRMLTVDQEELAKWLVMEMMARGNPI